MKILGYACLCLFLSGVLSGCGNAKKEQEAAQLELRAEVLAIHDEVMPMMGELTGLAGQLKQILQKDSLIAADLRTQMETAIGEMEEAEEGMMTWMAEFKQPEGLRATMEHDAIMAYLQEEKDKISRVNTQIKEGIETGKALLGAYPQ